MSLIGKKPFVDKILDTLNETQLTTLQGLLDNLGSAKSIILYDGNYTLTDDDKGVSYVQMKLSPFVTVSGILCYKDASNCGLFVVNGGQEVMQSIEIHPSTLTYEYKYEHLSATEFRSIVDDHLEVSPSGTDTWTKKIKDHISQEPAVEGGHGAGISVDNCFIEDELELKTGADIGANLSNAIATSLVGVFADIKDTVPESSSATGTKGDLAFDGTYLYVCIDTNSWKRIAWGTGW